MGSWQQEHLSGRSCSLGPGSKTKIWPDGMAALCVLPVSHQCLWSTLRIRSSRTHLWHQVIVLIWSRLWARRTAWIIRKRRDQVHLGSVSLAEKSWVCRGDTRRDNVHVYLRSRWPEWPYATVRWTLLTWVFSVPFCTASHAFPRCMFCLFLWNIPRSSLRKATAQRKSLVFTLV